MTDILTSFIAAPVEKQTIAWDYPMTRGAGDNSMNTSPDQKLCIVKVKEVAVK